MRVQINYDAGEDDWFWADVVTGETGQLNNPDGTPITGGHRFKAAVKAFREDYPSTPIVNETQGS